MALRHPMVALVGGVLWALVLTVLLPLPLLLFSAIGVPFELSVVYEVAAFAIAGALAGRSAPFPLAGFAAAFLGAFLGFLAFASLARPPANVLAAVLHAAVAAVAAWAIASWHLAKVSSAVQLENAEKRRCRMCGARVGPQARRCWSCRASLERIT